MNDFTLLISSLGVLVCIVLFLVVSLLRVLDCDLTLFVTSYVGKPIGSLKGKVIWISGASSGIGESLAYELAKVGTKLVLSGHLETIHDVGHKCIVASEGKLQDKDVLVIPPFDIRDVDKHENVVNDVIKHFKKIDVLVNNVGRTQRSHFTDITHENEKEIFDINVFGQINLTRVVLRHFVENKSGHFVVTSSVAGKFGAPFSGTYTASKHALLGFFETIRTEYYHSGIRVTTVCPGPVFTPLVQRAFHSDAFRGEIESSDSREGKMDVKRCSQLMGIAIANQLIEVWISLKPILWIVYFSQYFPNLFRTIFVYLMTPERAMKIRDGKKSK